MAVLQILVSFPDFGFPDVLSTVTVDSLVEEVAEVAAKEWGTSSEFFDLSLSGTMLPRSSKVISHGVDGSSELTASLVRWFGKSTLTDEAKREKVGMLVKKSNVSILRLDTPTFTDDTGALEFQAAWIPDGILDICFDNPNPSVTAVGSGFLRDANLRNINMVGLQYITSIGDGFMYSCSFEKQTVDLSYLSNVVSLGSYFLSDCGLSVLDLTPLSKLTSIDDFFLHYGSSLKTLDLSSFGNLTEIGCHFLKSCNTLTTLDLTPLANVTAIGSCFLYRCFDISSLDLSALKSLTDLGENFLLECDSLSEVILDERLDDEVAKLSDCIEGEDGERLYIDKKLDVFFADVWEKGESIRKGKRTFSNIDQ
eukprot:TRINITY_DN20296_c0_g1_i1.p1 TRINITY_DN20296_c0_g1~~TRINITY_DN20296_c0_g1_i1.p1  ORF type:complete len:367 (+),score=34.70 TRINITY_DN20296_c0_g1_i1:47-1147(+)